MQNGQLRLRRVVTICFLIYIFCITLIAFFWFFEREAEGSVEKTVETIIKNGKIITYEKQKIREVSLPDKKLEIPNQIVLDLFLGKRSEWAEERTIIEKINFLIWPTLVTKVKAKRRLTFDKGGWQSTLLGEKRETYRNKVLSTLILLLSISFFLFSWFILKNNYKPIRLGILYCFLIGGSVFLNLAFNSSSIVKTVYFLCSCVCLIGSFSILWEVLTDGLTFLLIVLCSLPLCFIPVFVFVPVVKNNFFITASLMALLSLIATAFFVQWKKPGKKTEID